MTWPDSPPSEEFPGEDVDRSRGNAFIWSAFAALAFLVFELTSDPVIAAAAFCLKFALSDVVTASRLVSMDPQFLRGATCSMFHLSFGATKALGTSLISAFVIGVVVRQGFRFKGAAPGQVWQTTEALLWLAAWSWGAAVFVSLIGTLIAWQAEFKVWLSPGTLKALRSGMWPPRPEDHRNRIPIVIAIELTAVLAFAFAVLYAVLTQPGLGRAPAARGGFAAFVGGLIGGVFPVALAVLVLSISGRIRRAIEAQSPEECWPDDSAEATF